MSIHTLYDLFDHFDTNKDGYINNISFKRILNIINLPLNHVLDKEYTYKDLIEYIKKYGLCNKKRKVYRKKHIKNIVNNHNIDNDDMKFVMHQLISHCSL